jgi:ABC-type sugar transport system ATPase subunit
MELELQNLSKTFVDEDGHVAGAQNVNLSVEKGEGFSLLRPLWLRKNNHSSVDWRV